MHKKERAGFPNPSRGSIIKRGFERFVRGGGGRENTLDGEHRKREGRIKGTDRREEIAPARHWPKSRFGSTEEKKRHGHGLREKSWHWTPLSLSWRRVACLVRIYFSVDVETCQRRLKVNAALLKSLFFFFFLFILFSRSIFGISTVFSSFSSLRRGILIAISCCFLSNFSFFFFSRYAIFGKNIRIVSFSFEYREKLSWVESL